jgi:hypothetical protein
MALVGCARLGRLRKPAGNRIRPPERYKIAAWPTAAHEFAEQKARRGFPPGRNSSVSISRLAQAKMIRQEEIRMVRSRGDRRNALFSLIGLNNSETTAPF